MFEPISPRLRVTSSSLPDLFSRKTDICLTAICNPLDVAVVYHADGLAFAPCDAPRFHQHDLHADAEVALDLRLDDLLPLLEAADPCLLYTSDAADDLLCVDLGGRRII